MEPRIKGRVGADSVVNWWHALDRLDRTRLLPTRFLPAALVLSAMVIGGSMPLAWHHLHIPGDGFRVVNGLSAASWLLVIAGAALPLAIRTFTTPIGRTMKWTLTVLAVAVVNGMFIDYFDWSLRDVSLFVQAYYGPGFFVALGAAALSVSAAVFAWRTPD
jgi:hypothetical protein